MTTRSNAVGSLALTPRRQSHVHGDGDDGTTTRAGKAAAMLGGINLRDPIRSIRRHRNWRRAVGWSCIAGFAALTALAWWRVW